MESLGTVILHPLVLLGISDQVTRIVAQHTQTANTKPRVACGVLLGRQLESQFELSLSFEMKMDERSTEDKPEMDFAHFNIRLEQTKIIFPNYDVLGWYIVSSNTNVNKGIVQLHQTFISSYPSALLMVFNSTLSGTESLGAESSSSLSLPVAIYETLAPTRVESFKLAWADPAAAQKDAEFYVQCANDGSIPLEANTAWASRLLPLKISVESGEAERIAIEHVVNTSKTTTEDIYASGASAEHTSAPTDNTGNVSKMAAFLSSQRNALHMLHKDIVMLKAYVGEVMTGNAPFDPEVMQLVQRVLSNKPVVQNDEQFDLAMVQEATNLQLLSYLAGITHAVSTVRDMAQRSNTALLVGRNRHAAYISPAPGLFEGGGMSDMASGFGGHGGRDRRGRQRKAFDGHFR
ncbi:hypothetical protein LPJ66_001863 [Kickxella alabastrina]|uniref:Uncharacterized protein n=1 Tax=Kickxella alabastrina TaxID=61397 RepID=A0ACC1IS35_9FUNG|nr:hypothetical protein LPJ66_001863 [Kickxella alabastrina]